jgi:hypothetical protein
MDKDKALDLALEALEYIENNYMSLPKSGSEAITAIKQARALDKMADNARELGLDYEPVQEPVLQDIEQYRLQMAGISTAAIGYWKEGDGIHPDYDTPALRDVAKLYAKYDALYTAAQRQWTGLTDEEVDAAIKSSWGEMKGGSLVLNRMYVRAIEAKLKEKNESHRQHVTDGNPCWCDPENSYTDPETGASVIVHKEPQ